jgi:3-oxoacyl-[acyl-carrier protein] reductase
VTEGTLQGVPCIVTGGGRGIGRVTAEGLAARGGLVAICARTASELDETADAIEKIAGRRPLTERLDVGDHAAVGDFAARVAGELGPPGLLVNNAAVLGPVGPIVGADLDEWQRALAVNVGGVATMCAAVAPTMSSGGAIVNLSGAGVGGNGLASFVSAYAASKAAVVALTEALAGEFAEVGITVNAVAPGAVATRFLEPVLAAGPEQAGPLYDTALASRDSNAGSLEDFVRLVCYLASAEGCWLSGRLLSARWDRVEDLIARREAITASSLYRLRRIDDALYREVPS